MVEDGVGCVVEVNSETDFVANNEEFKAFVNQVAQTVIKENPADVDTLLKTKACGSESTIEENLQELFLKLRKSTS